MARKPKSGPASDPELLILLSLAQEPKHGYAIMADVESMADVRLGPGTLYGALSRLEERFGRDLTVVRDRSALDLELAG